AALGVVPLFLLGAGPRDGLVLARRPAGFLGDVAVLFDQELVRGLVAVDPAGQRARHLAVRTLRAVFVDHVEHDEFGVQSRLSWHGLFSRFLARRRSERCAGLRPEPNDKLQNTIPGSTVRDRPCVKSRSSPLARRTGFGKRLSQKAESRRQYGAGFLHIVRSYEACRLVAAFLPLRRSGSMSKEIFCPSLSVRMPARSTAEMCTNTSGPPASC